MGRLTLKMEPNAALVEMLRESGELDDLLAGHGPRFESAVELGPPAPPAVPFSIPRADWYEEERERQARENPPATLEEAPSRYPPPKRETQNA